MSAAFAVATSGTLKNAAEAAGVAERTLRDWMAKPAFVAKVRAFQAEILEASKSEIRSLLADSALALRDCLDPKTNPQIRLTAAQTVLRTSRQDAIENFESRIAALEKIAAKHIPPYRENTQ